VGLGPEAGLARHVLEHLVLAQISVAELRAGDVARNDVEPVRIAGSGQELLRLGDVVLVVLPVRAELLALGVETPAAGASRQRARPVRIDRQAFGPELRDVVEDIEVKLPVPRPRHCLAYSLVPEGRLSRRLPAKLEARARE